MIRIWFFILSLRSCSAVIYHLSDAEYQRMPPLFSLDEYNSCLVEEGGTYCMLQLNLYAEPGNQLMRMIIDYSDHSYKHYDHSIIDRGVCVKKTCQKFVNSLNTTLDLTHSLEACLNDSLNREYGLNARVSALYYCDHHNEPRYIDSWDWIVLVLIIGIVIMNILGSAYDYTTSKEIKNTGYGILISFSLMRNWEYLTNTEIPDDKTRNVQFFNGIRTWTNLMVLMSHALMSFVIGFTINPHDVEKSYEVPLYQMLYNGLLLVQVFFFISGFLMAQRLQIEEQKRHFTVYDILKIVVFKFCRLLPVLATTLALSMTWVRHVGSGPLWKMFITGSLVAHCRSYLWHHLFFVNNYMQQKNFCLIPTWHLAADMQVFLVAVSAYMLTRGRTRHLVLATLLLLGAAAPALHTMLQDVDTVVLSPENYRTWRDPIPWFTHILGHNHILGFIIGMVTATWLHYWQDKEDLIKSRWVSLTQYIAIAGIPLILYSGHVFYQYGVKAPVLVRAAYTVAVRMSVGLACSISFTYLFIKKSTYMKSLFEWRYWVIPCRLSYCVFLIHMVIVHMMMGARTQLNVFSFYHMATTFTRIVVVSYLASLPFYLMVEVPFATLFRNLTKRRNIQSTSSTNGAKKDKIQ